MTANKARLLRRNLHFIGLLVEKLLMPTTSTGPENIPTEGVVICEMNHAHPSTYHLINYANQLSLYSSGYLLCSANLAVIQHDQLCQFLGA